MCGCGWVVLMGSFWSEHGRRRGTGGPKEICSGRNQRIESGLGKRPHIRLGAFTLLPDHAATVMTCTAYLVFPALFLACRWLTPEAMLNHPSSDRGSRCKHASTRPYPLFRPTAYLGSHSEELTHHSYVHIRRYACDCWCIPACEVSRKRAADLRSSVSLVSPFRISLTASASPEPPLGCYQIHQKYRSLIVHHFLARASPLL